VKIEIKKPYLVFLGDVVGEPNAKTAFGLRDWCAGDCLAEWSLDGCTIELGLKRLSPREAAAAGAKSMVIGVAAVGGVLPDQWITELIEAMRCGLDLVSGLHDRLSDNEILRETARHLGRTLYDVRHPSGPFRVANGRKRPGKRLLTVGTDCALGKKYAALALTAALRAATAAVDFRATGQTGILISGSGVALDSVVADYVAGAAEDLSPANDPSHWDVIEGQGSLFHPAYAGVTLGLIHGSQPDALVLCHDPLRRHLNEFPDYGLPDLRIAIECYLQAARLTNPRAQFVGVCLNTSKLSDTERARIFERVEHDLSLPCFDPLKQGIERVVDNILAIR
jgi:uncharacterized NAD-dependent epimerase/dehydratase family protein